MLEFLQYATSSFWRFWYCAGIIFTAGVMLSAIASCLTPFWSQTIHHHHYAKSEEEENDRAS